MYSLTMLVRSTNNIRNTQVYSDTSVVRKYFRDMIKHNVPHKPHVSGETTRFVANSGQFPVDLAIVLSATASENVNTMTRRATRSTCVRALVS